MEIISFLFFRTLISFGLFPMLEEDKWYLSVLKGHQLCDFCSPTLWKPNFEIYFYLMMGDYLSFNHLGEVLLLINPFSFSVCPEFGLIFQGFPLG